MINKEKSPYEPNQMYAELFNQRKADGSKFKTSPRPNSPNWYFIYLGGNFLEKDINKGFKMAGFTPKRNYTMHKGTSA